MLLIVTARVEGVRYADAHIADSNCNRFFCGRGIPSPVIECGLNDIKNPWVNKTSVVTCQDCNSEWHNGRRTGFHDGTRGDGE